MGYALLADLVVLAHLAYVAFVVLGQAAICAGAVFGWSWVRNARFRFIHLAAIVLVALESLLGIVCPLTRWENQLRQWAGEAPAEESLEGHRVHPLFF